MEKMRIYIFSPVRIYSHENMLDLNHVCTRHASAYCLQNKIILLVDNTARISFFFVSSFRFQSSRWSGKQSGYNWAFPRLSYDDDGIFFRVNQAIPVLFGRKDIFLSGTFIEEPFCHYFKRVVNTLIIITRIDNMNVSLVEFIETRKNIVVGPKSSSSSFLAHKRAGESMKHFFKWKTVQLKIYDGLGW